MANLSDIDRVDFVMEHVTGSKIYKSQFIDKWQEILANFMVEPFAFDQNAVQEPYIKAHHRRRGEISNARNIVLKDGETHKAVMTWASKIVLSILGDPRNEYIRANPVGWEDAPQKAPTVTKLLRYCFSIPSNYRSMVEAVMDMILFGTAIVEIPWRFEEREQLVRDVNLVAGVEIDSISRQRVVAHDDVALNVIDNADFYPDPGEYRLEKMCGVVKKFKSTALQARGNSLYNQEAVERAIQMSQRVHSGDNIEKGALHDNFREGYDQPQDRETHPDFVPMIGFEYWGTVPWSNDEGSARRVLTIINNEVVRDDSWPLADADLPFRSLVINPVAGHFYGVSPAEVMRYEQDFQDAMKILLAEAVIRQVHPPIAYDNTADIDEAALRRWSPDAIVPVQGGPSSIGTVQYSANVFNGFLHADRSKLSMQETSGALGALQGESGPNREAATVGRLRFQQAEGRPEFAAILLEKEAFPQIGISILRRYQQFLDTEGLALRVGEMPNPVWIGDIMGDFDIQFVGSRMAMSRQEKLQAADRLNALTATNPAAAMMVPWQIYLPILIGEIMEMPDVAAMIADPQTVAVNLGLTQATANRQGAGNNNALASPGEPPGTLPAQAAGGIGTP